MQHLIHTHEGVDLKFQTQLCFNHPYVPEDFEFSIFKREA